MSSVIKALKGLVVGGRDSLSMGRVAFWLTYGLAFYKWFKSPGVDSSHETVLLSIMVYVLGGKAVSSWKDQGREIKVESSTEAIK
ncbi:MAG: hypothetical protein LBT47_01145 [Deltaproteobacteria bacterium]|jgi:hypothetical protein|nr:hypothetical protein [Deltaproteobacteria bacterium]